jgi:hypothetical protein
LPDCFCSADGTKVPGDIEVAQVPQMVTLSFNGAMNIDNLPIYQQVTILHRALRDKFLSQNYMYLDIIHSQKFQKKSDTVDGLVKLKKWLKANGT